MQLGWPPTSGRRKFRWRRRSPPPGGRRPPFGIGDFSAHKRFERIVPVSTSLGYHSRRDAAQHKKRPEDVMAYFELSAKAKRPCARDSPAPMNNPASSAALAQIPP